MGPKDAKLSSRQRETKLGWISVKDKIKLATLRMTHKIAHLAVPEELAVKMPLNLNHRRLQVAHKLDTKPRELNKNKQTRDSYRNRAYIYNTLPNRLTALQEPKRFSKWLKVLLRDPSKLPLVIPTIEQPKVHPNPTRGRHNAPKSSHHQQPNIQPNQTFSSQSSQADPVNGIDDTGHFNGLATIHEIDANGRNNELASQLSKLNPDAPDYRQR